MPTILIPCTFPISTLNESLFSFSIPQVTTVNILYIYKTVSLDYLYVDMAKRAGRVGFGSGQSGRGSKRVTGQNGSFLNGSNGSRVESGCKPGQVDPYFSKKFFFFFLSRCNLPIVYEFLNYN